MSKKNEKIADKNDKNEKNEKNNKQAQKLPECNTGQKDIAINLVDDFKLEQLLELSAKLSEPNLSKDVKAELSIEIRKIFSTLSQKRKIMIVTIFLRQHSEEVEDLEFRKLLLKAANLLEEISPPNEN